MAIGLGHLRSFLIDDPHCSIRFTLAVASPTINNAKSDKRADSYRRSGSFAGWPAKIG